MATDITDIIRTGAMDGKSSGIIIFLNLHFIKNGTKYVKFLSQMGNGENLNEISVI